MPTACLSFAIFAYRQPTTRLYTYAEFKTPSCTEKHIKLKSEFAQLIKNCVQDGCRVGGGVCAKRRRDFVVIDDKND